MVQGVIDSWYLVDLMKIESAHSKNEVLKAGGEDNEENRKYCEIRNVRDRGRKEVEVYVLLDSLSRVRIQNITRKSEKRRGNILVLLRKEDLKKYSEGRIYSKRILDTEVPTSLSKQRDTKPTTETKTLPTTKAKQQSFAVIHDDSSNEENIYQERQDSKPVTYNTFHQTECQPSPSKQILTPQVPKGTRKRPRNDSKSLPPAKKPKEDPKIAPEIYSSIIKRAKKLDPTSALRKALSELDP